MRINNKRRAFFVVAFWLLTVASICSQDFWYGLKQSSGHVFAVTSDAVSVNYRAIGRYEVSSNFNRAGKAWVGSFDLAFQVGEGDR